jgi:hypothetical protein
MYVLPVIKAVDAGINERNLACIYLPSVVSEQVCSSEFAAAEDDDDLCIFDEVHI